MTPPESRSTETAARLGVRVAREILHETVHLSILLFRIMIPVVIVVKVLAELGMVQHIAAALKPIMGIVGLPGDSGIVWATALLTNLYGAIIAFLTLAPDMSLTVAQVTILTSMMLVAHSLPLELRIAQKAGAGMLMLGLFRFVGAIVFAALLNLLYSRTGWLGQRYSPPWQPTAVDASLSAWAWGQILTLGRVFLIILALMIFVRLLRKLGVIDLLERLLAPVLRLMGMTAAATEITVVGMVMGVAYGSGLILRQTSSGRIAREEVVFSLMLMGLAHALIEDTLLMASLGAHLSGILLGRVVFALATMAIVVRLSPRLPKAVRRWFYADGKRAQ